MISVRNMRLIAKNSFICIIIIAVLFSSFSINVSSYQEYTASDFEDLEYKQEIPVSIDTSLEEAKFQPIDIHINLNYPCWAKNETLNSLRICYDDGSGLNEIESQIYDLEYQDETRIKSCNVVFLIPDKSNGKEKYFACYSSSEINPSKYINHITIEDTHYFYEPISGQKMDFDYYSIREDGYVIYAVVQKGDLLGNPVALAIAKFKPGSKEVETTNIDQFGIFDMRYGIKKYPYYYGSSWAEKVNKQVLVDGNLMARVRMECTSPDGGIKTDNIYTYYYCPSETKRIYVNSNHEVIKTTEIEDPTAIDGSYAGIVSIKSRSASIEKMNVGDILPSLIIYSEDNNVKEFNIPQDPDSIDTEYILTTKDDCDLGEKAWVCLSNPSIGKAHGLIFDSNTGITELDGIQVKEYVIQNVKLPGLEADSSTLLCTRNAYEKNGEQNTILTKGFNAKFNAEFITVEKEGYARIDSESQIFQTMIKDVPLSKINESEKIEKERYSLTTFVHLSQSIPLGALLSAASGKPFPYIYAEIYKNDDLKSSGAVSRISLGVTDFNLEGMSLTEKIKFAFGLFDFRNATFFKKIIFPDLETGIYTIKIFKENPLFAEERQYIGFTNIELEKENTIHIYCRPQGSIKISISDQSSKGVNNVKCVLEKDGINIAETFSDENGTAILEAPCYPLKPYNLKIIYQGFLIEEKEITFGLKNRVIQLKESLSLEHYKLNLKIKDTWYFAPAVELNPTLKSNEMIEYTLISAEKTGDGEYLFSGLYPANYILNIGYKSFEIEKNIKIDQDKSLELLFPAEYEIDFDIMNSYGNILTNGELSLSRNKQTKKYLIEENGNVKLSVPPGKYEINICLDNEKIAQQQIDITGKKEIDIVTSQDSYIHTIIAYLGIILAISSVIFLFWKKKMYTGIKLFVIALLIIALVSPWWSLNGDDGTTSTTTKVLLFPPKIVTLSSSSDVIGGDVSQVPNEVTLALGLLSLLIVFTCFIIFITIFTKNKYRKINLLLSFLSIILLIIILSVFFYVMSQLTEVGVGSFIGSNDLDVSLPGLSESKSLPCSWGPQIGFYLSIIAILLLSIPFTYNKLKRVVLPSGFEPESKPREGLMIGHYTTGAKKFLSTRRNL